MNQKLTALLIILSFFSCSKDYDETFKLNEPFALYCGETGYNSWHDLSISFDSISPCPICHLNGECFCLYYMTEDQKAYFTLTHISDRTEFTLATRGGMDVNNDSTLFGFKVNLYMIIWDVPDETNCLELCRYLAELEISK